MSYSYATVTSTTTNDVVVHPPMSFRAIFAGWLVATGAAGLLYVAGLALGFTAFDAWNAESSAKGIGIGTAAWVVVTWVVALLLGGLFASWFDGHDGQTRGALHGVTVWGWSVAATGLWLALGLAHAMHGRPEGMADGHAGAGPAGMHGSAMGADGGAIAVLDANIAALTNSHQRETSGAVVAALIASHDDTASALLAVDSGTSQSEASQTLQRLAPQIAAARTQAKTDADRVAHYTAMSLWVVFVSSFLGLLAAAVGGWLGAGHIHRVYHLREYPGRPLN